MDEQFNPYKHQALVVEHLQALEAARSALLGDIGAFRQVVLKGSQLSARECENLVTHLHKTQVLLAAAAQACQTMIFSITKPIRFERRRAPRCAFGGVVEMSFNQSDSYFMGLTAEISRSGCFVLTSASVPVGTNVSLEINYGGSKFTARSEVVCALPEIGVGIKFTEIAAKDAVLLESWLRQT
jgi:hypothetical protein